MDDWAQGMHAGHEPLVEDVTLHFCWDIVKHIRPNLIIYQGKGSRSQRESMWGNARKFRGDSGAQDLALRTPRRVCHGITSCREIASLVLTGEQLVELSQFVGDIGPVGCADISKQQLGIIVTVHVDSTNLELPRRAWLKCPTFEPLSGSTGSVARPVGMANSSLLPSTAAPEGCSGPESPFAVEAATGSELTVSRLRARRSSCNCSTSDVSLASWVSIAQRSGVCSGGKRLPLLRFSSSSSASGIGVRSLPGLARMSFSRGSSS